MKKISILLCSGVVVTGCATATLVETEPGKRVVISVSPQGNPEARAKAQALADGECGGKKAVKVKEGRVVVGSQTQGESNQTPQSTNVYNVFTGKSKVVTSQNTNHSSSTQNTYEWHVTYECR